MICSRWCRLLATVTLLIPAASHSQAPQPKLREIAKIPGIYVDEVVRLRNGRVLLYTVGDSIVAYDVAAQRGTLVTRGSDGDLTLSPAGDRIAYTRNSEADPGIDFIWSLPIHRSTGAAAGPAQRVSVSAGILPSFSPDGKRIAFSRLNPGRERDLTVVPATGGAERIIATYPARIGATAWSSDGKWVYARVEGDSVRSTQRVPAAGGRSETVLSYAPPVSYDVWVDPSLVLSPPTVGSAGAGRLAYLTASGERGDFRIPPSTRPANGMGSALSLWNTRTTFVTTHLLNVADGKVRNNHPTTTTFNPSMVWSPDGRRLVLQTEGGTRSELTVMNADGSAQRRYVLLLPTWQRPARFAVQKLQIGGQTPFVAWSPDQSTLAWRGQNGQRIALLDLASGTTRILTTSAGIISDFAWRPDSRSIVALKPIPTADSSAAHTGVFQMHLDGTDRLLRDLSAEFPWATGARLASDSVVLIGDLGAARRFFRVPAAGGEARQIPVPPHDSGARVVWFSPSHDGKWTLSGISRRGHLAEVVIMATTGDSNRTVRLPFEGTNAGMTLLPDGRHLLVAGRTAPDTVLRLFMVPLDGSKPRVYGAMRVFGGLVGAKALSPDGRHLVLFSPSQRNTTIYELDLSAILRTAERR